MTLYAIRLSKRKSEAAFEQFMETELFPAIDKGQRRDGQVSALRLWKGNNTGRTNEYFWIVEGTLDGGAVRPHLPAIEAFGAKVKPMHDFAECLTWEAE